MAGIDSNTKLLLQMNGDRSDSQHLINTLGAGSLTLDTTEKKFGYSSMGTNGTNFMTIPVSSDFTFAGDFTIECWVRLVSGGVDYQYFISCSAVSGSYGGWTLRKGLSVGTVFFHSGNVDFDIESTTDLYDNQWHHIAGVRSGMGTDNIKLYIDGVNEVSATFTGSLINDGQSLDLGGLSGNPAGYVYNGWIDEVRLSDVARYTSDFSTSLPTNQFESDVNTKFLCHFEGDISDGTHDTTFLGSPIINATESKWHGAAYFNGSSYLTIPDSSDWHFTGDFTIDFWLNTTLGGITVPAIMSNYESPFTDGLIINMNDGGILQFTIGGAGGVVVNNQGTTINDGNWHHAAWVRSGMGTDNVSLYIDGTSVHTGTSTASITGSHTLYIGRHQPYAGRNFTGYLDEFRFSDTARWTEDFDVPLAPYSRFNYTVSGDITENGKVAIYNPTSLELIQYENVTAPNYSITTDNDDTVYIIALPTNSGINIATHRDITPIIS